MVTDVAAGAFIVALIYVLVRPGSRASAMIAGFGDMVAGMISVVTEGTNPGAETESAGFTGETADGNIDITE